MWDYGHKPGDRKLVEQAIRRKWKIRDDAFEAIPIVAQKIALDQNASSRDRLNAGRLLTTMHGQNEAQDEEKPGVTVNVQNNVAVPIQQQITEAAREPEYLEWLRQRAIDADASPICPEGKPGAVEDGPAPEVD